MGYNGRNDLFEENILVVKVSNSNLRPCNNPSKNYSNFMQIEIQTRRIKTLVRFHVRC